VINLKEKKRKRKRNINIDLAVLPSHDIGRPSSILPSCFLICMGRFMSSEGKASQKVGFSSRVKEYRGKTNSCYFIFIF